MRISNGVKILLLHDEGKPAEEQSTSVSTPTSGSTPSPESQPQIEAGPLSTGKSSSQQSAIEQSSTETLPVE